MSGPAAIPPEAVQAAAVAIHERTCPGSPQQMHSECALAASAALEAAEAVWPHDPPKRDPASTTHLVTDRSWTAARRATGHAVGFGRAPDHYLGGASIAEDIRDEKWEDATS